MWVCRMWVSETGLGWVSYFERFETEEEAEQHGELFVKNKNYDEIRDYELYPVVEEEE